MQERHRVSVKEFCHHHQVEITFIRSLHEYGLIELELDDADDGLLQEEQLSALEKLVRLHYDLQINLEGLDAIHHLLQKVEDLQHEVLSLRSRLRLYEGE